jgi:hypothetical protein
MTEANSYLLKLEQDYLFVIIPLNLEIVFAHISQQGPIQGSPQHPRLSKDKKEEKNRRREERGGEGEKTGEKFSSIDRYRPYLCYAVWYKTGHRKKR